MANAFKIVQDKLQKKKKKMIVHNLLLFIKYFTIRIVHIFKISE